MDKFSRTTEIDTAGILSAIEEDTPQKSRRGNIIALIICIIVAICIWAYVVEVDKNIYEKTVTGIEVVTESSEFEVIVKSQVDVTLKGKTTDLVDISRSDIFLYVDSIHITGEGIYKVPVSCAIEGADYENVQVVTSVSEVLIQVVKK